MSCPNYKRRRVLEVLANSLRRGQAVFTWVVVVATILLWSCRPQVPLRPVVTGDDPSSKTAAYLISRGNYLLPGAALFLDYPRRKFNLDWARPLVDTVLAKLSDPKEFATVGVFARMVDPVPARALKPSITQTIESFRPIPTTYAVLQGLYCDWAPPPAEFRTFLLEDKASLKHWRVSSLVALAYLKANGCLQESDWSGIATELLVRYRVFLDEIVASQAPPGAEFVETVGGIFFALGGSYVKDAWAMYLIEHQRPDGTWNEAGASGSDADDLTAAWGLLAILEYTHPQAGPVPVIPSEA